MAQVEIVSEREKGPGWVFAAQVLDDEGTLRRHEVALSWADYNLWSAGGADEPAAVASAVVRFMLSHLPAHEIGDRFDAAVARRLFRGADARIAELIQDRW